MQGWLDQGSIASTFMKGDHLYALVLALTISGLALAAAAVAPLRAVAALAPTGSLRSAWTWLTCAIVFCFLARGAAALGRLKADVGPSDLLDAFVHVIGPAFVLGVAWLSLTTGRELLRLRPYERLALEDPLTGLGNRRSFDMCLAAGLDDRRNLQSSLLVVLADVDSFKQVNDRLGHDVGDRVLRAVAEAIGGHGRNGHAFRLGGDEFAIVFAGPDRELTETVVDQLNAAIRLASGRTRRTLREAFSVSFGAAASEQGDTPDTLFRRADQALYEAKRARRATNLAA